MSEWDAYLADLPPLQQERYTLLAPLLAPILPYLLDPEVSEIFINTPHEVWLRSKGRDRRVGARFTPAGLRSLMDQLATFNGRQLGFETGQHPILEGILPCGSRVSGALHGVNVRNHHLTIRKHNRSLLAPEDLIRLGTVTEAQLEALQHILLVEGGSILVSGSTDAGKTTFLNTLVRFLPEDHRILVCEDTPELQIVQPHVVRFQTQPRAGITFINLLDLCMRQTGDHIVFGEIRAGQMTRNGMAPSPAYPFVMALNSGHGASMTTIHANGGAASLEKFVDYCHLSGLPNVPDTVYRRAVAEAFNAVVHLAKDPETRKRKVQSLHRVQGTGQNGCFAISPLEIQ